MSGAQTIDEALTTGQELFDGILSQTGELLKDKRVLAIGAGLLAAGTVRYMMQHPELIQVGLEQVGESLEIGGQALTTGQEQMGLSAQSITALGAALAPAVPAIITALVGGTAAVGAAGVGAATVIPVVPPPP